MFTQRELNLRQQRWLQLLKNYDMNVHYHLGKANVVADALIRMSMGSTSHIEDEKNELAKEIHRLAKLVVRLVESISGAISVHPSYESSLVVEFKNGLHLVPLLMVLKDSVLIKMNESFAFGGNGIHRYQDRLCVQDVGHLQTRIVAEAHGSRYSIHPGCTKMYHDLKKTYWWDDIRRTSQSIEPSVLIVNR